MAITDSDVKAIVDFSRDTTPFIETAEIIVTDKLSGKGLTDPILDKITLYLAAHLITLGRSNLASERLGEAAESYQSLGSKAFGSGLGLTPYGQTAMMLDTTGTLASMSAGSKLRATFEVVTPPQTCRSEW
jgi:hypothetical protein